MTVPYENIFASIDLCNWLYDFIMFLPYILIWKGVHIKSMIRSLFKWLGFNDAAFSFSFFYHFLYLFYIIKNHHILLSSRSNTETPLFFLYAISLITYLISLSQQSLYKIKFKFTQKKSTYTLSFSVHNKCAYLHI